VTTQVRSATTTTVKAAPYAIVPHEITRRFSHLRGQGLWENTGVGQPSPFYRVPCDSALDLSHRDRPARWSFRPAAVVCDDVRQTRAVDQFR